ncbi:hypothetical protein ACE1SV_73410 [Streptomyces sp. E-15]
MRRGQGYALRVTTSRPCTAGSSPSADRSTAAGTPPAIPAQRKARREYENRVSALVPTAP